MIILGHLVTQMIFFSLNCTYRHFHILMYLFFEVYSFDMLFFNYFYINEYLEWYFYSYLLSVSKSFMHLKQFNLIYQDFFLFLVYSLTMDFFLHILIYFKN